MIWDLVDGLRNVCCMAFKIFMELRAGKIPFAFMYIHSSRRYNLSSSVKSDLLPLEWSRELLLGLSFCFPAGM
jgi:hypothetical protein